MIEQGDWVRIEYGEYKGQQGKVAAVNKNASFRVLPYDPNNEPAALVTLDGSCLTKIEPLLIDPKELRELARGRKTYRDIADKVFPIFNMRAEEPYPLMPADIAAALQIINRRPDPLEGFKEWFWLIQNVLYDSLEIEPRYREDVFSDAPENEEELFSTIYSLTEKLYWKLEERFLTREDTEKYLVKFDNDSDWNDGDFPGTGMEETAYRAVCDDILSRIRTYEYNKDRPRKEWIYSPSQKRHIIHSYESEEALLQASAKDKALFKRCVADLYQLNDVHAMKILAWSYYDGDSIYPQNYKKAEKYMIHLYRMTGDPYAANALGNLYYHGLTGKGEPNYEKAFRYYSYGVLAGLDESIYHSGDMLIHGQGTVKNIDMGMNLIVDGYKDALYRFNDGEYDNRFAEYALRMGNICKENIIFGMGIRDAYKFYLEAEYAIMKRMSAGRLFGDEEVARQIREALSRIRQEYHPDPDRNVLRADFPIYISHIFEDRFPIRITIRKEQGEYTLKMSRFRLIPGEEPKFLVAFPELSYVDLVSELKFRLEDVGVIKLPEKGGTFLADGFTKNEHTNALEFYSGGDCVAAVEAKWYVIDVTKEKMLKKMNQGEKK